MNIILDYLRRLGKQGGKTTAKRGKSYYSTIGKAGARKRWSKKA